MDASNSGEPGPSKVNLLTLKPHPYISRCSGPLLLIILDGWGEGKYNDEYNAIFQAHTPTMDSLKLEAGKWRLLKAHGTAVGLPSDADMGNSEVGHNALGAGQIVDQGAKCVDAALASGTIFKHDEGWQYIEKATKQGGTLHLLGLLSDGGVHSRYDQLILLIKGAIQRGTVEKIRLHVLHDGRDVEDGTAVLWLERLQTDLDEINTQNSGKIDVKIASGGGRMLVTMDRYESDWKIVQRGWDAHILGKAKNRFTDPISGVRTLQTKGGKTGTEFVSDQWIEPWIAIEEKLNDDGVNTAFPVGAVHDGDAVVTFNFRADRMVEISKAFEYPPEKFTAFDRRKIPSNIHYAGLMEYDGELHVPSHYLVPPPIIERTSEQFLMNTTKPWITRVFAIAESQKIGHVTFFWHGNKSGYLDPEKERFVEVPSDQGIAFDAAPAMKAHEICAATLDAIASGKYDFIRVNFANADMVGHTGNIAAAVEACSEVDICVGQLLEAVDAEGGRWMVTADHGNAEDMVQRNLKTGEPLRRKMKRVRTDKEKSEVLPLTSHTLNPVPCAIGGTGLPPEIRFKKDDGGKDAPEAGLANVTATFLNLLGFEAPDFYEPTLLEFSNE
jgi:2,3-bisphosphoglycerate-independent phosphoglycerate mutase